MVRNEVARSTDDDDGIVMELVMKAQNGDSAALEALLLRYRPLMLKHIRKMRRHLDDGVLERDDLQQEAARMAIELIHEYVAQGGSFGSYLKQKLRWRLINYVRRERDRAGRQVELDNEVGDRLVAELEEGDIGVANPRLRSALRQLSPKQRSVLFKLYWEEKTTRQVAEELRVTDESVRALKRRAEARIRKVY